MTNEIEDYICPRDFRLIMKYGTPSVIAFLTVCDVFLWVMVFVRIENFAGYLLGAILFAIIVVVFLLAVLYWRIDDLRYRCDTSCVEYCGSKVIAQNTVHFDQGCFISKVSGIDRYRFKENLQFAIFSQKPFPKLDIPILPRDYYSNEWTLLDFAKQHIVCIPLNDATNAWLEAQFHTAQIPEYPKVLYKPAVLSVQDKESLDLWN